MTEKTPLKKTGAIWHITLNCDCPHCGENVDLLESSNFWEDRKNLQVGEHNTPGSCNVDVMCPECGEEFLIDCEF